jgi:Ca2+-binding EF-hand superfamily protein
MSDIESVQRKLAQAIREVTSPENFESLFQSMDADNSGTLSVDEFRNAVRDLGFQLTDQVRILK